MKIIVPGHLYELQNVDDEGVQHVNFVQRRGSDAELLPLEERRPGIQTQELLRVAIDRTLYLHAEQVWHENVVVINSLRTALRMYEVRAAHRNIEKLGMPERASHCQKCGHIFCFCQ